MTAPDTASTIMLPPTDTVKVWEERQALHPTVNWREMMHEEHASAFTVAKIAKLDLLSAIRESLDSVIRDGGTFEQWKANILPELQRQGWWGLVQDKALTGTEDAIVINDNRLRTIYRTNVRMSMAGGLWRKIQREKDRAPYLRYLSNHYRKHPREDHQSWHGLILPVDDPAWQWMFPPNGWGCKCHVQQVTEDLLKARGWKIGTAPTRDQMSPQIAEGFDYNPGTAHLRVLAERSITSIERALALDNDGAAETMLREVIADPSLDQFLAMPEGAFPVAILSAERQQQISAPSRVIVLPSSVYRKQLGEMPDISRGHPELGPDDYRNLPDIVAHALVIAQDGDSKLIYFSDVVGRIWKAVVRYDVDRTHPAVVSFHGSGNSKITAETSHLQIILDNR